ncbi:site-specific integrase [Bradyrhizobium sp. WBAH42]|nr:integrase [Bradyrhizobium sp. WBAH30]MDD1541314.1 integrase [Bradyrhizobium sp. WBAH41]MDD1589584.1 integrase [Bradyrhizobium sp. WBAH42]QCJ75947.1 integrase [Bradyrhizobium sp. WBAH10]QCJ83334.1 integrase [Bradyrhizobium sp. WBAH23]QCJ90699.1 integrase [Bradyrhizobium yuanmingense]QCJ98096.1 integrase [Bradyrhizobium sp. WBAH33]
MHTAVASFTQLPSGNWRVQVRRKNRYVSETFRRRKDGEDWALDMERNIDRSGSPKPRAAVQAKTFGDIIDLHIEDMQEVGRPPRRSKAAVLEALKEALGTVKLPKLNRERLIEFGRQRAKEGAGPATLAIDFSFIRTVATHASAVHGIEISAEEVRLARYAMKHLGLVGNSEERDRRPTEDELGELIEYFETNPRQVIPMGRIVRYAVATTMRQEEICRPDWPDVDLKTRVLIIRDRKDPRAKDGNDQKVPLLNLTGFDAWEILLQQRIITRGWGRVFPYIGLSIPIDLEHLHLTGIVLVRNRIKRQDAGLDPDGHLDVFLDRGPVGVDLRRIDFDFRDLDILLLLFLAKRGSCCCRSQQ